jgi:hypothetical protein
MNATKIHCFIFTALPCEANAFIRQFNLKKHPDKHPFSLYYHQQTVLTVTGVGKVAMAAAVAYTLAIFASLAKPVLINAGIAGHPTAALGQLFSVHKITDVASDQHYYPQSVINLACSSAVVYTVANAKQDYPFNGLSDMEASGFYEIATHFTSSELIQVVKIVSDNPTVGIEQINAKKVNAWMNACIATIADIIQALQLLACRFSTEQPRYYHLLTQQYYFNVNHSHQLNRLLQRWDVVSDQAELDFSSVKFHHSKAVLQWLQQQIESQVFSL